MKVEELQVLISANADQFHAELGAISAQMTKFGKATEKTSKKVGGGFTGSIIKGQLVTNALMGVMRGAVRGFTSLTKAVIKNGGEYSRLKIATETVAKNMGITSTEVDGLRDSLADANTYGTRAEEVIKTLALSGLVTLASELKEVDARTGDFAFGVEALVLGMKDLSATAGVDSATGIQRLTRFIRRGEVGLADGIIEIGNINQSYSEYAQSIGKTVQQLSGEEKSRVRMNIVMDEAKKSYGAYANIFQSSSKAFESVGNVVRTLTELLGSYLEPIFSVVANSIFQFFAGLRKALIDNKSGFQNWAVNVAGYLVAVVRIIGSLLTRIPYIGKYFQSMADFSVKPIKNLASAVDETKDSIGGATGATKKLKKELAGLAGFDEMNTLTAPDAGAGGAGAGAVGGGGGGGGSAFEIPDLSSEINAQADDIEKRLKENIARIKGELQPLIDAIKWLWDEVLVPLGDWIKENIGTILTWGVAIAGLVIAFTVISGVVTWVMGVFSSLTVIWGVVTTVIGVVATAVTTLATALGLPVIAVVAIIAVVIALVVTIVKNWDEIVRITKVAFQKFFESISSSLTAVWDFLVDLWNAMGVLIQDWIDRGIEDFNEFWTFLQDLWKALGILINDWIKKRIQQFKDIQKFLRLVWEAVGIIIRNFINNGIAKFKFLWDTLKKGFSIIGNWIRDVFTKAKNWVVGVIDKIKERFATLKTSFGEFIGKIVDGVKAPINNIIDKINVFLSKIRGIKVPVIAPDGIQVSNIPKLARGGVVDSPTLAVVGESGKEAVMPLENNTGWISELADKISSKGGGGGTQLVVKLGENKIFDQFVDFVNDQSMATNTKIINI